MLSTRHFGIHISSAKSEVSAGVVDFNKMGGLPVPHFTSFCCCVSLEIGAYLIGGLHFITAVCLVAASSYYASEFGAQVGTVEDAGDHLYSTLYKYAVGIAVLSTVHVLLSLTLLYGTAKRKTSFLRGWVLLMSLLLLGACLACIITTALTGVNGTGSDIFLTFLEALLFFGFVSYCIMCVHSYYLMLKSFDDMQGPTTVPY